MKNIFLFLIFSITIFGQTNKDHLKKLLPPELSQELNEEDSFLKILDKNSKLSLDLVYYTINYYKNSIVDEISDKDLNGFNALDKLRKHYTGQKYNWKENLVDKLKEHHSKSSTYAIIFIDKKISEDAGYVLPYYNESDQKKIDYYALLYLKKAYEEFNDDTDYAALRKKEETKLLNEFIYAKSDQLDQITIKNTQEILNYWYIFENNKSSDLNHLVVERILDEFEEIKIENKNIKDPFESFLSFAVNYTLLTKTKLGEMVISTPSINNQINITDLNMSNSFLGFNIYYSYALNSFLKRINLSFTANINVTSDCINETPERFHTFKKDENRYYYDKVTLNVLLLEQEKYQQQNFKLNITTPVLFLDDYTFIDVGLSAMFYSYNYEYKYSIHQNVLRVGYVSRPVQDVKYSDLTGKISDSEFYLLPEISLVGQMPFSLYYNLNFNLKTLSINLGKTF